LRLCSQSTPSKLVNFEISQHSALVTIIPRREIHCLFVGCQGFALRTREKRLWRCSQNHVFLLMDPSTIDYWNRKQDKLNHNSDLASNELKICKSSECMIRLLRVNFPNNYFLEWSATTYQMANDVILVDYLHSCLTSYSRCLNEIIRYVYLRWVRGFVNYDTCACLKLTSCDKFENNSTWNWFNLLAF
jgi:hypothetical protein